MEHIIRLRWSSLFIIVTLFNGWIICCCSAAASDATQAYVYALCPDMTTVGSNSRYHNNTDRVLSYLATNTSRANRFYNTSVGSGRDKVYGLFFCRLDVNDAACKKCVSLARDAIGVRCPGKKESTVWYYDQCVVHYSDKSFLGTMRDAPMIPMWNRQNSHDIWNVTNNMDAFTKVLLDTMWKATINATDGRIDRKFATKEARFVGNLSNLNTLYTLVECTPDISLKDCRRCLQMVIGNTSELCNVKAGCTLMCPNCNMRYDIYPFYGDDANSTEPLFAPIKGKPAKATRKQKAILISTITAAVLALIIFFGVLFYVCRRKSKKELAGFNDIEVESLKFDLSTIRTATNSFSDDRKLGEGGFGEVFRGKLDNGEEVAVKRLSKFSRQGISEFKTELLLVAELQHRNLVKLLGYSLATEETLLVYEYLPNSSLDRFLTDPKKSASLDWKTRFKIISGIARGLLYLHEDSRLKIIHRDLKASNVLLDEDMNPKISDFGMARLFKADETQRNTSRIAGTFGYMAPEYVIAGHYSAKSDVYSFGILVLEIVSGQLNNFFRLNGNEESLLDRAWKLWDEGSAMKLVDSRMGDDISLEEAEKCIHIGLLCIQEDASRRPRMATIVAAFNGDSVILPRPTAPHFFAAGAYSEIDDYSGIDLSASAFTATSSTTEMDPR
ncbi:putative receptor-like protein kinase At4g00960 [Chenopodium quinoa]|uniref:putative receptor-like protein kinase At4g00960 n=1 Tax=Chenopodium quinoa TaxID=63459 RepID=UPI000B76E635|nr:putative receptor-like protein kinase At4g00960 [Chenopodium quinoa]